MTDAQIKEAATLLAEIKRLEEIKVDPKQDYVIGRTIPYEERRTFAYGDRTETLAPLNATLTKELIAGAIAAKKATLNDLRAGC